MRSTLFALSLVVVFSSPILAQDFNYTPGWSNTQNFNRLHKRSSDASQPRQLELCRFNMLPRSEQRLLQQRALAKIDEVGEQAAMPWINQQSETAIAQMVADGLCKSE